VKRELAKVEKAPSACLRPRNKWFPICFSETRNPSRRFWPLFIPKDSSKTRVAHQAHVRQVSFELLPLPTIG
jgi:hypothetical protein